MSNFNVFTNTSILSIIYNIEHTSLLFYLALIASDNPDEFDLNLVKSYDPAYPDARIQKHTYDMTLNGYHMIKDDLIFMSKK